MYKSNELYNTCEYGILNEVTHGTDAKVDFGDVLLGGPLFSAINKGLSMAAEHSILVRLPFHLRRLC